MMVQGMAAQDGGAASVLSNAMRMRKYAVHLVDCGYSPDNMEALRVSQRYGNSKAEVATACVLLPVVVGWKKMRTLAYIIKGQALPLVGCPVLVSLGLCVLQGPSESTLRRTSPLRILRVRTRMLMSPWLCTVTVMHAQDRDGKRDAEK